MKNSKRILCSLVSAAIALSMAACQSGGGKNESASADGSGAEGDGYTTVTVFCPNTSSMPMTSDTLVIKEISEKTKTRFEFTVSPTTGAAEKFNLMMSSGDIPDLTVYMSESILKYTKAFAPLNDLIAQYAPSYQKLMDENPGLRRDITAADGNIYTIQSKAGIKFANAVIIRQDWLDKLGLEAPATLDDYYNMLKAFKEQDPNGNGEADEIPLVLDGSRTRYYDLSASNMGFFTMAYGVVEDFMLSEDGSEVIFGAVQPQMKEALTYLNKLYAEGLLDAEYLTRDDTSTAGLMQDSKAGMYTAWGIAVDDVGSIKDPTAELNIILPPIGVDGTMRISSQMRQTRSNAAAVSKDSKVKEHIMSIWDYVFSDEGTRLINFGVEGVNYEMADGKPKYLDQYFNGEESGLTMLRKDGINSWIPHNQLKEAECGRASQKFSDAIDLYEPFIIDAVPDLKFTEEEKSTITSVYTSEIKTYMDETLDSFITGKMPLDQFDAYVEQMNKMGLPDILKIYNDAFARYQQL